MCFTWSENASAYCLLAWWFLTSIDKATQLQTDWLLMLTLTGLIASLKLLLLSCKQAYYNDKEGLYSYSCSRNAFWKKLSHMHRKTRTCLISVSRPPEDNNLIFQPEIIFFILSTRGRQCSLFILLRDKGTSSMIWNLCEELCSRGSTGSYRNWPFGH